MLFTFPALPPGFSGLVLGTRNKQMEAVKPLCDLCGRLGIFNSIMLSYQSSDDVFDTQLGVPYHCESKTAHHERPITLTTVIRHLSRPSRPTPPSIFAGIANGTPEDTRCSSRLPYRAPK
jgi:hypothetical protein